MTVPSSFRAAVLRAPGTPLEVCDVRLRFIGPGEVLVRVDASGLCHTDLEIMRGTLAYPTPVVLGHELAGTVEAVGSDVHTVRPGERIIGSWNPACGRCFYCDRGQPILCEVCAAGNSAGRLLDGGSRLELDGQEVGHFNFISSHAEYAVLPERSAVPVDVDLAPELLCLVGCSVMTAYGAVMNVAQVERGSAVAVIGCGAVGLNAVQAARLAGARAIIGVDLSADRRSRATHLGATHVIDPSDGAPGAALAVIREATAGRGADAVFECAGVQDAMRLAFEATRSGGILVLLGKLPFDTDLAVRFGSLMGEKRIVRSSYGGARPHRDYPRIVDAARRGDLQLAALITHRLTLDSIGLGFEAMGRGETVRAVVISDP